MSKRKVVGIDLGTTFSAIATLDDLMGFLEGRPELHEQAQDVAAYRQRYGARNG